MSATNGFFGQLQGPFTANQELFNVIQSQCKDTIDYLSKIGIHYVGNYDLDINNIQTNGLFVNINNISFQIGKLRTIELEDVEVTSIIFPSGAPDSVYIDYQYKKI